jgi:hypothetical protein
MSGTCQDAAGRGTRPEVGENFLYVFKPHPQVRGAGRRGLSRQARASSPRSAQGRGECVAGAPHARTYGPQAARRSTKEGHGRRRAASSTTCPRRAGRSPGWGPVPSRRPPQGLPHGRRRAELVGVDCRIGGGLPAADRMVGRCQVDGMARAKDGRHATGKS